MSLWFSEILLKVALRNIEFASSVVKQKNSSHRIHSRLSKNASKLSTAAQMRTNKGQLKMKIKLVIWRWHNGHIDEQTKLPLAVNVQIAKVKSYLKNEAENSRKFFRNVMENGLVTTWAAVIAYLFQFNIYKKQKEDCLCQHTRQSYGGNVDKVLDYFEDTFKALLQRHGPRLVPLFAKKYEDHISPNATRNVNHK